jgi:phage terminase small subunit
MVFTHICLENENKRMVEFKKLTAKQQLFVEHYLISGNATDAARKAGYKGNDHQLGVIGAQNLGKLDIKEAIEKAREKGQNERNVTRQEKQEVLSEIIRDKESSNSDKIKAMDTHNKMDGEYITKVEHSGDQDKPIKHEIILRSVRAKG